MPRPNSKTNYQLSKINIALLNKASTKLISALRHVDLDNKILVDNIIRAMEYIDDARISMIDVQKAIRKGETKMKKWRKMHRALMNDGAEKEVEMPITFFDDSDISSTYSSPIYISATEDAIIDSEAFEQ